MPEALDVAGASAWLRGFAGRIAVEKDWLTELDSAIGDGDHGVNMHRGMQAVAALEPEEFDDARGYAHLLVEVLRRGRATG